MSCALPRFCQSSQDNLHETLLKSTIPLRQRIRKFVAIFIGTTWFGLLKASYNENKENEIFAVCYDVVNQLCMQLFYDKSVRPVARLPLKDYGKKPNNACPLSCLFSVTLLYKYEWNKYFEKTQWTVHDQWRHLVRPLMFIEPTHSISITTNNDVVPFQLWVPFSPHAWMILFVSCDKQETIE